MEHVGDRRVTTVSDEGRGPEHSALLDEAPALQAVMDELHGLLGLGMSITDLSGKVLVATGWQDICTRFHRANPESCRNCVESDTTLAAGLRDGEHCLYRCQNSMWELATPITVGGKRVAHLFFGQFFFDDEVPDRAVFEAQALRFGFDPAEYLAALDRVPRVSRARVQQVMALYSRLAVLVGRLTQGQRVIHREEALRAALDEARLRGLSTRVNEIELLVTVDGAIVEANDRAAEAYGYSREELLGLDIRALRAEATRGEVSGQLARAADEHGVRFETEHRRRDGSTFPVEVSSRSFEVDGQRYLHSLIHDLTGQRQNERDTRMLAGLVSTTRDALVLLDLELCVTGWQGAASSLYGYSASEALGQVLPVLLAERTAEAGREVRRELLAAGGRVRYLARHRRRSGDFLDVDVAIETLRDGTGGVVGYFAVSRDVTEQTAARRALAESEARLRLALGASRRVEWELDVPHGLRIVGPEWPAVTGRTREEGVDAATWYALIHPEDLERVLTAVKRCVEGSSPTYEVEYRVAQPTGGWRRLLSQGHVTASQGGKPLRVVGTLGDVTELRELQARAARAERVASLATLASGMAHEMNNPLSVVLANLAWAVDELGRIGAASPEDRAHHGSAWTDDVRQALLEAGVEARRVGDIVGRLRLFAGNGVVMTSGRAALGPAVEEALRLVAGELARCRAVEVEVPANARVAMSELALVQLLANLLKNAGQATGERPNQVRVTANLETPGMVAIVVADLGEGMDAHALAHAFDPFFSTRSVGREIGLGLPVCLGLAQAVGGDVRLESAVGQGTTVTVVLPLAGTPVPSAR